MQPMHGSRAPCAHSGAQRRRAGARARGRTAHALGRGRGVAAVQYHVATLRHRSSVIAACTEHATRRSLVARPVPRRVRCAPTDPARAHPCLPIGATARPPCSLCRQHAVPLAGWRPQRYSAYSRRAHVRRLADNCSAEAGLRANVALLRESLGAANEQLAESTAEYQMLKAHPRSLRSPADTITTRQTNEQTDLRRCPLTRATYSYAVVREGVDQCKAIAPHATVLHRRCHSGYSRRCGRSSGRSGLF